MVGSGIVLCLWGLRRTCKWKLKLHSVPMCCCLYGQHQNDFTSRICTFEDRWKRIKIIFNMMIWKSWIIISEGWCIVKQVANDRTPVSHTMNERMRWRHLPVYMHGCTAMQHPCHIHTNLTHGNTHTCTPPCFHTYMYNNHMLTNDDTFTQPFIHTCIHNHTHAY